MMVNYNDILQYSKKYSVLLRGQLISVLIAGTGVFATFLSSTTPTSNIPTLMNLINYILLSTFVLKRYVSKRYNNSTLDQKAAIDDDIPRKPLYWYMFAALLDMEANFLVILAYNYTSVTSIMLLDCFTIPSSIILSRLFLSYQYSYKHVLGATVCILGLVVIVITDVYTNNSDSPANALLGDVYCLVGSFLYACSNVLQEYMVKSHNREEYLGLLGSFGSVIALVQCFLVDYSNIRASHFSASTICYLIGFNTCLFLMYTNASLFLVESDATLFNLSLLTSDVYAVIFSYFFSGQLVHWTYFIAFCLVVVGLGIYHNERPPTTKSDVNLRDSCETSVQSASAKYELVSDNLSLPYELENQENPLHKDPVIV